MKLKPIEYCSYGDYEEKFWKLNSKKQMSQNFH